jgi:protein-serine/threonine kinase
MVSSTPRDHAQPVRDGMLTAVFAEGADSNNGGEERGRSMLSLPLQIPKNRSTGNLAANTDNVDRSRFRFSFDAGSTAGMEYDAVTRLVDSNAGCDTASHGRLPVSVVAVADPTERCRPSNVITDHEHGLGLSGLRRIRQQPNVHHANVPPSNASSRSPSVGLSRSTSMTLMLSNPQAMPMPAGPSSPSFSEDLSRFPSESLHSFSFAHQSEEYLHNRQNVLKRSLEFMKDRIGWSVSSSTAAMASAHARVTGDMETQHMLDLLAKAKLVDAANLPSADLATAAPLTSPADMSGANLFDRQFIPRTSSPETIGSPIASPTTTAFPSQAIPVKDEMQIKGDGDQSSLLTAASAGQDSENSSRTPTNESGTTQKTSPPSSRRPSMKRTMTDTLPISLHHKLMDTMAQPFLASQSGAPDQLVSPTASQSLASSANFPSALGPAVHGHSTRWVPAAQAIFTTEAKPPWTIIAANDLACLVFGVTKAEVRKMGILEVVQEERRAWLEQKLMQKDVEEVAEVIQEAAPPPPSNTGSRTLLGGRGGITAQLLSKPNSRTVPLKMPDRRAQTVHGGDPTAPKTRGSSRHRSNQSRGVLLCGDVVPIQKRNGATGSASLWVKEKRIGLIWVLEEIHEDVAMVAIDEDGIIQNVSGETAPIWGFESLRPGIDIGKLIPRIPRQGIDPRTGEVDFAQIARRKFFTCPNSDKVNIPCTVEQVRGKTELRVSSFPHMAGIIVASPEDLRIKSSNSVFCGALFGYEKPDGMSLTALIPDFDKMLGVLTQVDGIQLVDGLVVPEHSFRKASAFLALRENRPDAGATFLRPDALVAKHRDGSYVKIDVQMRVVKSEKHPKVSDETVIEESEDEDDEMVKDDSFGASHSEMVFALWITYSRHFHSVKSEIGMMSPHISGTSTPLHQPSPGQTPAHTPIEILSDSDEPKKEHMGLTITRQLKEAAMSAAAKLTGAAKSPPRAEKSPVPRLVEPAHKKTIDDFVILEDMGQGAYGQVKLARYKHNGKKVVLKYVTKRRILVDTWTRDRKLGTVPLEIHVLDYLRRSELRHPNIVEMEDFFEDDVNYYIEMVPHGLPGMDLFDYIELRSNMEEAECRSIFVQVARAIHHLHIKAAVVHRDIKDENVILDGEGNIKLIDFGSAAYIKSGPFDVFVGTIGKLLPRIPCDTTQKLRPLRRLRSS